VAAFPNLPSACDGGRGSIDPAGVIERDLDGDGRDDLIIAHEAISCTSGGQFGRSMFCGMQVCSVMSTSPRPAATTRP